MLMICILSLAALCLGLAILRGFTPFYKRIFPAVIVCWLGHILGTFAYSLVGSDSHSYYFPLATPGINQTFKSPFGSGFILNVVWYVRLFLTGDSFLATLFFFGMLGFLGSILWYCLYLKIADELNMTRARILAVPAWVILCWPSILFFTAGMKDAWPFLFLPLFFICLFSLKTSTSKLFSLGLLVLVGLMILMPRPYLILIIVFAWYLTFLAQGKNPRTYWVKIGLSFLFVFIFISLAQHIVSITVGGNIDRRLGHASNFGQVASQAVLQQQYLSVGTSFPMSTNPALLPLLLPYSFLMNLCFPLFIFSNNLQSVLQSFENLFLIYLLFFSWKKRKIFAARAKNNSAVRLMFFYFVVGMSFLALINTNLGLSTREKAMYLPAFLIVFSLAYGLYCQEKIEYLRKKEGKRCVK